VNDMERLTRRSKVGEGLPVKHLNLSHKDTTSEDTLTKILDKLADYEDTGLTPDEISRLHTLIEQQERELNRRDELIRKLDEERDYWELEAKRYCSALGEQKIKLQKLKCEMCKDIGKCVEC